MLEELNEGIPVAAAPVAPTPAAPAPAPASPPVEVSVSQAPSSRGWTMFMEAELQGPKIEEPIEVEPEFYDGTIQTDSGTVVAFAPTAAEPNASFRRAAEPAVDLSAQEPMKSFGSRLRGDVEEAAPRAPSLDPVSVPSVAAEVPSFAGNNLGFAVGTPTAPAEQRRPAQPDALDHDNETEASTGGGNKMIVIGVVVVVAIVIAVVLATR
jgi:hypothetical protein